MLKAVVVDTSAVILLFNGNERATPIPINDMWVAALALQYNRSLAERDEHFERVENLELLKI